MTKRRVLVWVQAIVSLGLIWYLLSRFHPAEALEVVVKARIPWVVAGFGFGWLFPIALAKRLSAVLAACGAPVPLKRVVSITWSAQFLNFFLPGSAGGDIYKIAALASEQGCNSVISPVGVLTDRLLATFLLMVAGGFGLFYSPRILDGLKLSFSLHSQRTLIVILFGVGVIGAVASLAAIQPVRTRVLQMFSNVTSVLSQLGEPSKIKRACLWAIVSHFVSFAMFYSFAHALGLGISFLQVCLCLPVVLTLLIVPLSLNGHGIREFLLLGMFTGLSIQPLPGKTLLQEVIALSIIGLSSDFFVGAVGGMILFFNAFRRSARGANKAR